MNVYANLHDITTTFKAYLEKIPFYGKAFVCIDDLQIQSLLPLKNINTVSYGLNTEAEWSLKNLSLQSGRSQYTLIHNQQEIGSITLNIPGEHNALNSLAAIAVAYESGIPLPAIIKALSTFTGVDRRFTYRGSFKNIGIFDDYGHHPTEIACTLKNALQQASGKPLTVIFQPHRYTRTHSLWKQFIELFAFAPIDTLIITDLYSANEEPIEGITSKELSEAIHNKNPQCNVHYIPYENDHKKIITFLEKNTPTDGLLLLQGAGSVTKIIDSLLEK